MRSFSYEYISYECWEPKSILTDTCLSVLAACPVPGKLVMTYGALWWLHSRQC